MGEAAAGGVPGSTTQESRLQELLEPISTGGWGASGRLLGSSQDPPVRSHSGPLRVRMDGLSTSTEAGRAWLQPRMIAWAPRSGVSWKFTDP